MVNGVDAQLARVPADATHLVVSVGGNDALRRGVPVLHQSVSKVAEALERLAAARAEFRREYRRMLNWVQAGGQAVTVCTVYDAVPGEKVGLALFNDVILDEAVRADVPVIDLRRLCTEAADFATLPIEPSVAGGAKIAAVIVRAVSGHDFTSGGCRIFS